MVDVRKRTLQWQENLERAKRPEDNEQQYPPVEVTTLPCHYEITAQLAARLNTEIANYNRHRNALSLWNALAICLENKIPVPDKVSEFFLDISQKLIGFARDGEKQASRSISNLVLGTISEDGGRGEFRSFQNIEKERDIVRRTGEIILQRIAGKLPALKSLEAIYETVAQEFSVEPEHVKRLFRLYEADAGSFGFRELLKAATSPPQVFASGLDTTHANPDDAIHSDDPPD
ncbi:hypothetical protein [Bradyrhizobium diazoefficiens]|uniref:Uncharacterized protein n=1 Tax=Bradyrhizobium diazoefficiens TaxID=1355477 RepID=A0A809YCM2_9BRAD|nr:hypothetical protein [Bradyrhizobium diazoefficiens]BBZ99860.1 hypothetical protein H12S4_07650 [Bradyrhizobium diazoefficiens]BCA17544.1 hypothetical protein BDHH15_07590 [Bradyrhizobium diazoefficiens]BCE35728.1 hypothetical protein XF3B_07590 [Bradyrhizobium diazoefficiens]BCF49121.1 hypothetical protein XF17B_07590 [Bradyrhizobium diazoefficiens]